MLLYSKKNELKILFYTSLIMYLVHCSLKDMKWIMKSHCMPMKFNTPIITVSAFSPVDTSTSDGNRRLLASDHLRNLCKTAGRVKPNSTNYSPAIILPGCHDTLSAKIFANAGAEALFVSGFGISASRLGQPDAGVVTQTEM